jgi:hypothetical protein
MVLADAVNGLLDWLCGVEVTTHGFTRVTDGDGVLSHFRSLFTKGGCVLVFSCVHFECSL